VLHASLWQSNADLARCILEHPFVRGLSDGSLNRDAFRRYVAQDAFFLRAFVKAYALAAAKCDDFDRAKVFHGLMTGVFEEIELHESYAASLGIELEDVDPFAATLAYTDFLQRVAWHRSLSETIAAMVPCMRVYHFLGVELTAQLHPAHPYESWIQTYASDEFKQLSDRLESLLDEVSAEEARNRNTRSLDPAIEDVYRYAMRCEFDFFSAPFQDDF